MSDSVQPHKRQPTRLLHPWDSPGKNTGVGCHFLLQCIKVKSEVAQACLTLHDLMDCSLPGSSAHGIFQARAQEWGVIAFSESVSGPPLFSFVKPSAPFPQSCSSRNAFFFVSGLLHQCNTGASKAVEYLYVVTGPVGSRH